jgi:hypothetical protein
VSPEKLDLYKVLKEEYATPKKPVLVKTTPGKYLTVTGRGEPGGESFRTKMEALYAVAFTIKMTKKFSGQDYKVCGLEGLWWGTSGVTGALPEKKADWNWKLIIRTPDSITKRDLTLAIATQIEKGGRPGVGDVQLERIGEGLCVQMLHVGPYRTVGETALKMKEFVEEQGLSIHGLHHEIYLSDPRRVPEDRLRTILRMPVK